MTRTRYRFPGKTLDLAEWNNEGGGWGNGVEAFTRRNVTVSGSELRITARREADGSYTSGLVTTRGRIPVPPGHYIEARMLVPTKPGCWPSFYLVGANEPDVAWPACGEIDVLEVASGTPHLARRNLHGADSAGRHVDLGWDRAPVDAGCGLGYEWHTYGAVFDGDRVRLDVDRAHVLTITRTEAEGAGMVWAFDQPQHLMFALSVGKAGGDPVDGTLPQTLRVSRVDVWPIASAPCRAI